MEKLLIFISIVLLVFPSCRQGARKPSESKELKQYELVEVWRTDTTLRVPESVIYDYERDIIYVSNLNYEPRKKDGNGFISKLGTDGKIVDLHWADGLHSPKGLALVNDKLYTADIDELVEIDINKGEIVNRYTIDSIKMINDITSDQEGNLYISDSDANKIYKFSNGLMVEWMTAGLNAPNGLLAEADRLLLASMGSMDFVAFDIKSKEKTILTEGISKGDGIAYTGIPGYYMVTDWFGEIFLINPDYTKVSLLNVKEQEINCADICFIPDQKLLIAPTFYKHYVVAYKLVEK